MYKKPSTASFTLKKSRSKAMLGTPRPLSLKTTSNPTRTPQKLGESWDRQAIKCCKTLLIKGCRGKRRPFSKAVLKEANHLRHLDDVRSKGIEAPNMNARGGPIARGEGMSKKGLDSTKAHSFNILHNNPQVVRTARVPNLTDLVLAFAKRGRRSR